VTRYDEKIARIRAGNYSRSDFIIADAKDGDMGSGVTATAPNRAADGSWTRYRTRSEFLDQIENLVRKELVDIMLVSQSNLELLVERGAFANSKVKPVIRANNATDAWGGVRNGKYPQQPSLPFRSADLARAQTNLGLYSMTFLNDAAQDSAAQTAFAEFRADAEKVGFKYFLEVFNPNINIGLDAKQTAEFVNDSILRCLAGLTKAERPEFLKIPFNSPDAIEELATFDPDLVVGVLGGGAGTNRDTFELISQAERFGARVALFGRKINLAESQEDVVKYMRLVANGDVSPDEAVRAYHGDLQKAGIKPIRTLEEDNQITEEPLKHAS
jgi:hypothetical protein